MNYLRAVFVWIVLIPFFLFSNSDAGIQKNNEELLNVRASQHAKYLRIVLEGRAGIIFNGKVSQTQNEILVNFPDSNVSVKKGELPLEVRTDKDAVIFKLKNTSTFKTFSLENPARIVIDVYDSSGKKDRDDKPVETNITTIEKPIKEKTVKAEIKETEKHVNQSAKSDTYSSREKHSSAINENKNSKAIPERPEDTTSEDDFVPDEYKGLWTLLKGGNFYTVLKVLPDYKPQDANHLAVYHYMYGDAYRTAQQYLDAVKHLRLAYIYSVNKSLKERALFERGEIYQKLGLLFEARADYIVFIKEFASSGRIASAHLNLADTLTAMDLYNEAVEHYNMAGDTSGILFSKANALQRIGRVSEARKVYADALKADRKYPSKSPETYFLIGENMRMLGEVKDAKTHFSSIGFGEFKDNARLSLGHIDMDASNIQGAINNYKDAAGSRDSKVRVQGLMGLSKALTKAERFEDAISTLEVIRHNYINSELYKDALLELSKLYRKEGKIKNTLSMLKELVYGQLPPKEAFQELESILLEASEKTKKDSEDDLEFVALWNDVGKWMLDDTRENFLLKVNKRLRYEGKPFLDLSKWLVEKGSKKAKAEAAADLAGYYAGIENMDLASKYLDLVRKDNKSSDDVFRVELKMLIAKGEHKPALDKLIKINKINENDLEMLGSIIPRLEISGDRIAATAFYEKKLNESDWDAEKYIKLADILYANEEKNRSLKYYEIAYQKNPDDEWTAYRIGQEGSKIEAKDMFNRVQKGDTVLSRMARTKLMEIELLNKMEEVY